MSVPEPPLIESTKQGLRCEALARRDAIAPAVRRRAADAVSARPFPVDVGGRIVSGFFPMRSEINPMPLMRALAEAGANLALPVIQGRRRPLLFRVFAFGDPLAAGVWGIREPFPERPEVAPDVLIVPLAAFDRSGQRIGYGAGYYDLTLHTLAAIKPIVTVGLAFAAQEIAAVPASPRDFRLDLVLTERELIDCRLNGASCASFSSVT
jgi:5-formyltetrahydrofolate cyclo-ligase